MRFNDIRKKYIEFFVSKANHAQIPAAPIVPPDDPTTLFTSSGMQQLVPYLKGEAHSMGTRLVDSQPSFRAEDIEEVGDNRHTTMFEMLGNWSLGDYFKAKQLPWFFEFLTKEVGLDSERIYVTVFEGDDNVPRDEESIAIWQSVFKTTMGAKKGIHGFDAKTKIYIYDAKKNWWSRAGVPEKMPTGEIGGPDSEVFYDFDPEGKLGFHEKALQKDKVCHVNCDCGRFLEIGNSVFMQYEKQADGSFKPLPKQNVDFGGGLERITAASQNTPDVFQIDMFRDIIEKIEAASAKAYEGAYIAPMRVIADHLRAATFMIAQGLEPGNKMQGYILRRLIRRALVRGRVLGADLKTVFRESLPSIIATYSQAGFIDPQIGEKVESTILIEIDKFSKVLDKGLREIEKASPMNMNESFAFNLYQSYGFPFEILSDLLKEKGVILDELKFNAIFQTHKDQSRTSSAGMFKGGLADHSEAVTKYHTTTHLLQKAMQIILGNEIKQEGSNLTGERLRFDYQYSKTPTEKQLTEISQIVNQKIKENLPVIKTMENKEAAIASGAMAFFKEKYPEQVSVYTIGTDVKTGWFSKELCGGPHVTSTGEIGAVTIKQDKSIGANIRRIYVELVPKEPAHGNQEHIRQN